METGPVQGSGVGKAGSGPRTLGELVRQVLGGMVKGLVRSLPLSIGILLAVTAVHTYLLVMVNEGFGTDTSTLQGAFLSLILILQGGTLPVAIFWLLVGTLGFTAVRLARQGRLGAALGSAGTIPERLRGSFDGSNPLTLPVLLLGAGAMVAVMSWLANVLVAIQLTIVFLGALVTRGESLTAMALRLGYGDVTRNRGPQQAVPFNPSWTGVAIAGALAGMVVALLLKPGFLVGLILGIVLAAVGYFMAGKGTGPRTVAPLLLFSALVVAALVIVPVLADDGGWQEAGGTFDDWVQSEGAVEAVARGAFAGAAAAAGVALGAALAGMGAGGAAGAPAGGPRHGDTRTILDGQGRPVEETYNEAIGAWETEDERMIRISREGREKDAAFIDEQRRKLETRDTAHDRALDEMVERQKEDQKTLDNLQRIRRDTYFGPPEVQDLWKGHNEPGDVTTKVDDLIRDLVNNKGYDKDLYDKVRDIYGKARKGEILSEDKIPTDNEILQDTISTGTTGSVKEIVTGVDSEGRISFKSMGLRLILGVVTGGSSELVYTPAESLNTMKDYVDKGGDSILGGASQAVWDVIKGEAFGKASDMLADAGGTIIKAFANEYPAITKPISGVLDDITGRFRGGKAGVPDGVPSAPKGKVSAPKPLGPDDSIMVRKSLQESPPLKTPQKIVDDIRWKKSTGQPYPGMDSPRFIDDPKVDLTSIKSGYSPKDQKWIQHVSEKHGVKAVMRPTNVPANKDALTGWKNGVNPKPELIKQKTVNTVDMELGFDKNFEGLAAAKQPVLPPKTPQNAGHYDKLEARFKERMDEYKDTMKHLDDLKAKGQFDPNTGIVTDKSGTPLYKFDKDTGVMYDGNNGKPFAGDNDAMAFVDAVTGEPVSPFTNSKINQDLQQAGVTIHNEHIDWKVPDDPSKRRVDTNVLKKHTEGQPNSQPLLTYNPLNQGNANKGWAGEWYTGSTERTHYYPH